MVARQFYRNVLVRDDKCSSHMLMVHELRIARRDNLTDHVSSVTRSFHPPIAD